MKYDYDLERVAMKRAAEIALSYDHERPIGGYAWDTYRQENIRYSHAGENIAAAQTTASQVNFGWREDNEPYGGQGHRRNMLSSDYNCVGIGHVYYNGVHYWVEAFANRPEINTTEIPANDSTETVSVSVDKKKIKTVDVTFDQDAYSLRIGENITPIIKETRIGVE
ncbi:MAG: CAP domain-containing protein [Anaerobutyricum hallii]